MTTRKRDEELARYFEERRGDVSIWAEKPTKIRVRRGGPSTVFSVRFTKEELNRLQQAADVQGVTVSELVRTAALREAASRTSGHEGLERAAIVLREIADQISAEPQKPARQKAD